jgi:UDP-N-acetylmuramoylalanine--D-glutamate ligase
LEFVRTVNGSDWYNDSKATAPQETSAAIRCFERPLVLLLGGRDKGLPWEELAELTAQRAAHVITFGEAGEMISGIFARVTPQLSRTNVKNLAEAVGAASKIARPGDVVLLSPGGTSFDEFVDFEDRGEHFRQLVNEL